MLRNADGKVPGQLVPVHRVRRVRKAKAPWQSAQAEAEQASATAEAAKRAAERAERAAEKAAKTRRGAAAAVPTLLKERKQAQTAAKNAEDREVAARDARAAALALATQRRMAEVRPWGSVIPPSRLKEEAVQLAEADVDAGDIRPTFARHKLPLTTGPLAFRRIYAVKS